MSNPWRLLNGGMAALFAVSAILQLNDPDPAGWFLLYAAAATSCLMVALRSRGWVLAAPTAAAAGIWAIALRVAMNEIAPLATLFEELEMKTALIEETRELLGLGIIALWMLVICAASRGLLHDRGDESGTPISAP